MKKLISITGSRSPVITEATFSSSLNGQLINQDKPDKEMKMIKSKFGIRRAVLFLLPMLVGFSGCREIFDLPEETSYLGKNLNYSDKKIGRASCRERVYEYV